MARLWNYFGREPYLVNPHLVVASNPPRKRRYRAKRAKQRSSINEVNMRRARDSKGRFLKLRRRHRSSLAPNPRRRRRVRRHRRNVYAGHPPRHRRRHTYRRRRAYRRHNRTGSVALSFLGIEFPDLATIGFTAGGFIVPPFVEGFASRFLPAQLTSTMFGRYLVKIGAVAVNALAVRQLVGTREAKLVTLGGSVYLASSLLTDFAPAMIGAAAGPVPAPRTTTTTGYYNPGALGSQPLVGEYAPMGAYQDGVPERLRPGNRY
jgi:hypothetical protein